MLIGKYFKKIKPDFRSHYFSGICFNSKLCEKNHIFFAIKGNEINGNNYIKHAISKGAKTIVYNKKFQGFKNGILYLSFNNVRKILAETSYKIFCPKIKNLIAVTGTNGKSSICNFYYQILNLNKKSRVIRNTWLKNCIWKFTNVKYNSGPITIIKAFDEYFKKKN